MAPSRTGRHTAGRYDVEFRRNHATAIWTALRPIRSQNHHDGTACDDRPPFGPAAALQARACSKRCDQIWVETIWRTGQAYARLCQSDNPPRDHPAWIRTVALSKGRDAVQRLRLDAGVLAKPARAVTENRFLLDAFDDTERAVLGDILHYLAGDDSPEDTPFPLRRLADRHGRSETELAAMIERIVSHLELHHPLFAEQNITRPLSEKLAQHVRPDPHGLFGTCA